MGKDDVKTVEEIIAKLDETIMHYESRIADCKRIKRLGVLILEMENGCVDAGYDAIYAHLVKLNEVLKDE